MFRKLLLLCVAILILAVPASPVFAQQTPGLSTATMFGAGSDTKYKKNRIHLKLRADAGLILDKDEFVGGPAADTARLNAILAQAKRIKVAKLVESLRGGEADVEIGVRQALAHYYYVTFAKDIDPVAVASELQAITSIVEAAYPEPLPAPPTAAPLYTGQMNYFKPAPEGINTNYATTYPGGTGAKVKVVDIEYSWNTQHTDLMKARTALVPHGTPADPFGDTNHGTAVIGQLISTANNFGVTGGVPAAGLALVNANNTAGYDPAGALAKASSVTVPGDIVLIEQQAFGPSAGYVPLEWIPEVYDAIRALTTRGVIVIEAAANGSENLSDASLYGAPFPMGKLDSGAIIVGAGENCLAGAQRRVRLDFSNYGARVNLQAAGNCVVTTGYGDLYSAEGVNSYYTATFGGTSSASPIVASAAAALSSAHETLNNNAVLTPQTVRTILRDTGTPQVTGSMPGNIGPLPNLAKALVRVDITSPTVPTLTGKFNASNKPVLTWTAATDNVKVAHYKLFRNGVFHKQLPGLTYTDTGVTKGTTYNYKVQAVDTAGRPSAYSNVVTLVGR